MIKNHFYILLISVLNLIVVNYVLGHFISLFKNICIDVPNKRSLHKSPMPTSGGTIVVLSLVISYLFIFLQNISFNDEGFILIAEIIFLCLPLAICGFIDDIYDLSEKTKFLIQSLTAFLLMRTVNIMDLSSGISFISLFSLLLFFIFIIGFINMVNFMDGIDGLISGVFSFIFLILSIKLNVYLLPISLGFLGFFFWNWPPAKIFLGDSGSTFLGGIYAAIILSSNNYIDAISLFLLISPLFLDSITCFLRRLKSEANVFKGHKKHLYQRLVQNGLSHKSVTIIYISATFFISIFYLLENIFLELIAVLIIFLIGVFLEKNYAIKFSKS